MNWIIPRIRSQLSRSKLITILFYVNTHPSPWPDASLYTFVLQELSRIVNTGVIINLYLNTSNALSHSSI